MKLAFIGIGKVGFALANNFQKSGHEISIAHNNVNSDSVIRAQAINPSFSALPVQQAIDGADVVFLATPFNINEALLRPLDFKGTVLVDCTNPVGAGISHGLESKISGAEKIQEWSLNAKVVKSYTIYGFENLENPNFPNYTVRPVMLISGNDLKSKENMRTSIVIKSLYDVIEEKMSKNVMKGLKRLYSMLLLLPNNKENKNLKQTGPNKFR